MRLSFPHPLLISSRHVESTGGTVKVVIKGYLRVLSVKAEERRYMVRQEQYAISWEGQRRFFSYLHGIYS